MYIYIYINICIIMRFLSQIVLSKDLVFIPTTLSVRATVARTHLSSQ